ncbi:aminopeptidase P family protein [Oscillibacter hominis]|uniref:Aminopeptidase P family protein n=1 Tax=Oscillibacter hominis TaxID=2763056 RepID=A0A7G9B301_9FIRM|nr:Xaa-Pro peptidase family protein [Oscillibacter hominis]QNL43932.1 aminopeptidase P family protein [Oscillibacter hominis]
MNDVSHVSLSSPLIPPLEEFESRQKKLDAALNGAEAMLVFSARSIFYLTGCALSQTERPVVLIHIPGKENILFVPRMEREHVEQTVKGCRAVCYTEYPDEVHPMERLRQLLEELHLTSAFVAADAGGYSSAWGYRGPALSELCPEMKLTLFPHLVPELRKIKSPFELMLMRESSKWSNLAHVLLKEYSKPGLGEIEICLRASSETASAMLKAFGPHYRMSGMDKDGVRAVFRGQVGKNAALPHAVVINAKLKEGDGLVTGTNAYIQGYFTEMERVLFVGEPSPEQLRYYNLALEAQKTAFSVIKPGVRCSEVDREMRRFYRENGLQDCWRHHTGHAIGTEGHEIPFFDIGDDTVLQPGMCMTVEPGLYVEGLGGFRVSDTLHITETGVEQLTYFPKDLEEIICS